MAVHISRGEHQPPTQLVDSLDTFPLSLSSPVDMSSPVHQRRPPPLIIPPPIDLPPKRPSKTSQRGLQETYKLLDHLLGRLEARAVASDGLFGLAAEARTTGGSSRAKDKGKQRARDAEDDREETGELVEHLRDLLILSENLGIFRDQAPLTPVPASPSSRQAHPALLQDPSLLVPRLLTLLDSLFARDALAPTPRPRPRRPPLALQASLLDIATLLIASAHERNDEATVVSVSEVVMRVWAGLALGSLGGPEGHGGGLWGERVLRFWEDVLRGGLEEDTKPYTASSALLGAPGASLAGSPAIQVISSDATVPAAPGGGGNGWHHHVSPTSPSHSYRPVSLEPRETVASLVPSLLAHILDIFPLPLKSPLLAIVYRVHRVLSLLIERKPDCYLDLLSIVSHGSSTARSGALALLTTFWPKGIGHVSIGRPFPVITYEKDLYQYEMNRQAALELHDHHFIPHLLPALPSCPSSSSLVARPPSSLCQTCETIVEGFCLRCTLCEDVSHHGCYHPRSSTVTTRFISTCSSSSTPPSLSDQLDSSRSVPIVPLRAPSAVLTFSKVPCARRGRTDQVEAGLSVRTELWLGEHHLQLVNLFALTLCGVCNLPLWGTTMQAYGCSGPCSIVVHPSCLRNSARSLGRCRPRKLAEDAFDIDFGRLRETFIGNASSFLTLARSESITFAEAAIVLANLQIQLELLQRGCENRTVKPSEGLASFELDDAIKALEARLQSEELARSDALLGLFEVEGSFATSLEPIDFAHHFFFSTSFLSLVAYFLKSPDLPSWSNGVTATAPASSLNTTSDHLSVFPFHGSTSPFEPSPSSSAHLSRASVGLLRTRLALLGVTHPSASSALLAHLHTCGFVQREDNQASLFLLGPDGIAPPEPPDVTVSFLLPRSVDTNVLQVENLVGAIEACLASLSISENEVALNLMARLCRPSGSSQSWVMERLARAVLSWMLNEESVLVIIARDYIALNRLMPGVAEIVEYYTPMALDAAASGEEYMRAAISRGPNQGSASARPLSLNDYKSARRTLSIKYAVMWLLRLHDCDPELYASLIVSTCSAGRNRADSTAITNSQLDIESQDAVLRNIAKLASLDVVFSILSAVLGASLDNMVRVRSMAKKPVSFPSLHRLFGQSPLLPHSRKASLTLQGNGINGFPPSTDPWAIIMDVSRAGKEGQQRGLLWITVLAQSGVSVPSQHYHELANLVFKNDNSLESVYQLSEALFASCFFDAPGKQDQIDVVSQLVLYGVKYVFHKVDEVESDRGFNFVRETLGSLLLLYGCPRDQVLADGFGSLDDELLVSGRVAASRSAARFSVITRNLDLRLDVLEALEVLMKAASPKLEVLPGRFLLSLLTKATLVKERSSFVKEHQTLLFSSAWRLFDSRAHDSSGLRMVLLLQVLRAGSDPLRSLLDEIFIKNETAVETKSSTLDTLFLVIVELNDTTTVEPTSDLVANVVPVLIRFFSCLWDPRDEILRSKTKVLANSLLPAYFDTMQGCFELYIDRADCPSRIELAAFLNTLQPYFPSWQVLSWSVVCDLLFEQEFDIEAHKGPTGGRTSAIYNFDDLDDIDPVKALADTERLRTIVLSLRWIGDGMYIDLFSLLKLKYHLVAVLGFQGAKIVPARDGKTFSIEIGGLHQLSPVALACASGLKRVLDSPKTLEFPPSAMYLSDSEPSNQLVGSAFADVVIKIFTSKIALENMSYLEQRTWLECLMILSYKHNFSTYTLAHLEAPLMEALKTSTALLLFPCSVDCQQIILSTCRILLDQWEDGLVAKIITRLITIVCKYLLDLKLLSADAVVTQARSFVHAALQKFGKKGVLLLLFKASNASTLSDGENCFDVVSALQQILSPDEAHQIYIDILGSITLAPRPAFTPILSTLNDYAQTCQHNRLPRSVIEDVSSSLFKLASHVSDWSQNDLDPNPLLCTAASLLAKNKRHASVLSAAVVHVGITCLGHLDVAEATLDRLVEASEDSALSDVVWKAAVVGLAPSGSSVTPRTLASLTAVILKTAAVAVSKVATVSDQEPRPINPQAPALTELGTLGVQHLLHLRYQYSGASFDALMGVARLTLVADAANPVVLNAILARQVEGDRDSLGYVRLWSSLALASLNPASSSASLPTFATAQARLLALAPFAGFAFAQILSNCLPYSSVSQLDELTVIHLSSAFAFAKLWLLLARSAVDSTSDEEAVVWSLLWPPLEQLLLRSLSLPPSTITSVLHSIFADLTIFLVSTCSALILPYGAHLEALLLDIERWLSSSTSGGAGGGINKQPGGGKTSKALRCLRTGMRAGEEKGTVDEEIVKAAEELRTAERLSSAGAFL